MCSVCYKSVYFHRQLVGLSHPSVDREAVFLIARRVDVMTSFRNRIFTCFAQICIVAAITAVHAVTKITRGTCRRNLLPAADLSPVYTIQPVVKPVVSVNSVNTIRACMQNSVPVRFGHSEHLAISVLNNHEIHRVSTLVTPKFISV